ncbi:Protein Mpv17 [Linum perenne]
MSTLWKWFQRCMAVHPVKTQMISSGLISGAGDFAAQSITHSDYLMMIDWKRVASTSLFGLVVTAMWNLKDRFIRSKFSRPNSLRFIGAKVVIDALVFSPLDLLMFFSYMGVANGKSMATIRGDVKRDFVPALVMEGGLWPVVQVANFRFVAVKYQLLYVNVFCLLDSCFLSWIEQQHHAPWKTWINSFLPFPSP